MTPWSDIISRLEKLSGPDRELADEILIAALGWRRGGSDELDGFMIAPNSMTWLGPTQRPDPTASLDAALALVPNGWRIAELWQHDPTLSHFAATALVMPHNRNDDGWLIGKQRGNHPTSEILALCIACCKARSSLSAPGERPPGG